MGTARASQRETGNRNRDTAMTDIVSVNVYLVDISDIDKMNDVYRKLMPDPKPTRVTVEVGHIRSGGRIEISCIAIKQ